MEYCAGGDLLHKIQIIGLFDNNEAYCFFKQILNGISYIHSVGVVHRYAKTRVAQNAKGSETRKYTTRFYP